MYELIREIIQQCGGRPSGSAAEWKAQELFRDRLKSELGNASFDPVELYPSGKFDSLRYLCSMHLLALVLALFNTWSAAVVAVAGVVLFFGHFVTYRDWLDPLFKRGATANVYGDIEPQQEVKRTLIFAGHMDSVREFQWWYRFGQNGLVATILAGFLQLLAALFLLTLALLSGGMALQAGVAKVIWLFFLVLGPLQLTLARMHGKQPVDGAIDNLSGIAISYGVGQHFLNNALQHTRIRVMSFGCEEAGLKGAKAYVKQHKDSLQQENAVLINIDSIRASEFVNVVPAEWFPMVKYPPALNAGLVQAFRETGLEPAEKPLQVGATDAARFAMAGLPAASIIGLPTGYLDPTYHTRRDTLEQLDQQGLEDVLKALVHFTEKVDRGEISLLEMGLAR